MVRTGLVGAPMGMAVVGAALPLVMGGVAVRSGWFELGIEMVAMPWDRGDRDTLLGFSVGAYGHSLRKDRIHLRHGLKLGVAATISFKRRVGNFSGLPMPTFSADLLGILIRLTRHLWLEIEPLTVGFPSIYEGSLALRWEI